MVVVVVVLGHQGRRGGRGLGGGGRGRPLLVSGGPVVVRSGAVEVVRHPDVHGHGHVHAHRREGHAGRLGRGRGRGREGRGQPRGAGAGLRARLAVLRGQLGSHPEPHPDPHPVGRVQHGLSVRVGRGGGGGGRGVPRHPSRGPGLGARGGHARVRGARLARGVLAQVRHGGWGWWRGRRRRGERPGELGVDHSVLQGQQGVGDVMGGFLRLEHWVLPETRTNKIMKAPSQTDA